jgi:hypothetical protein
MTISVALLSLLVGAALAVTLIAPLLLIALFLRDWKKGDLW